MDCRIRDAAVQLQPGQSPQLARILCLPLHQLVYRAGLGTGRRGAVQAVRARERRAALLVRALQGGRRRARKAPVPAAVRGAAPGPRAQEFKRILER